jgi:hypothetical protein
MNATDCEINSDEEKYVGAQGQRAEEQQQNFQTFLPSKDSAEC